MIPACKWCGRMIESRSSFGDDYFRHVNDRTAQCIVGGVWHETEASDVLPYELMREVRALVRERRMARCDLTPVFLAPTFLPPTPPLISRLRDGDAEQKEDDDAN